jgi:hypothetical protein
MAAGHRLRMLASHHQVMGSSGAVAGWAACWAGMTAGHRPKMLASHQVVGGDGGSGLAGVAAQVRLRVAGGPRLGVT